MCPCGCEGPVAGRANYKTKESIYLSLCLSLHLTWLASIHQRVMCPITCWPKSDTSINILYAPALGIAHNLARNSHLCSIQVGGIISEGKVGVALLCVVLLDSGFFIVGSGIGTCRVVGPISYQRPVACKDWN